MLAFRTAAGVDFLISNFKRMNTLALVEIDFDMSLWLLCGNKGRAKLLYYISINIDGVNSSRNCFIEAKRQIKIE